MTKGIYLPDGTLHHFAEPSKKASLTTHVASRDRSPDFAALGMYLPNPDPVLRRMGRAEGVYRDLLSDAHVGGTVRRRKGAVAAMERRVVAKPTNQGVGRAQAASATALRLCQDTLAALDLHALIAEIMGAPLYGYQPLEVMWASDSRYLVPAAVVGKPQEWFVFGTEGELRFRSRSAPFQGEELHPRKFLLARQDASYVNPYGFADLSMCFWPTTFKRGGLKFWVTFAEKFGTPWVVGKQPRSAGYKESSDLLDQLEAMVQDAVAVIPDDASVDIVEAGAKGDAAGAFRELLMFCRSEVSIALLGQNQSTEASSTHASASAGLEVAKDLRDADAHLVESTINQLLRWVVDVNMGEDAPAPVFELFEQEEVTDAQAKRDEALARSGARFTNAYYQRAYGLEDGDLADTPPPAPAPPAAPGAVAEPAPAAPEFAEPTAPRDAIDDVVDAELAQWQTALDPLVDPVQQLIDQAAREGWPASELLQRLPAVLSDMDPTAMANALTKLALTARLAAGAAIPTAED